MMHLFINSLSASSGGGLTYIRNVIPRLAARADVRVTVALGRDVRQGIREFNSLEFLELDCSPIRRVWYEQFVLPAVIQRSGANVLLSTGNFAVRYSPVPQILLSRNSIYTSHDFYRDVLARREYRLWLATHLGALLAKRSLHWADVTAAPSQSYADELRRWAGLSVCAVHHGFEREAFFEETSPLPADIEKSLNDAEGAFRLLFVSHYNYYRNFETLIRALPLLRNLVSGRPVRLFLTCKLRAGENPGVYDPKRAANLVKELGVEDMMVGLGSIPYHQLHHLYRRCHLYVTPAYTETFAHPLVEAMACGLPVVASDLGVHREICGDAALYFPRFAPEALAERIAQLAQSSELALKLAAAGRDRAKEFSWKAHVEQILQLAQTLLDAKAHGRSAR